jgi:hypothetical protein
MAHEHRVQHVNISSGSFVKCLIVSLLSWVACPLLAILTYGSGRCVAEGLLENTCDSIDYNQRVKELERSGIDNRMAEKRAYEDQFFGTMEQEANMGEASTCKIQRRGGFRGRGPAAKHS